MDNPADGWQEQHVDVAGVVQADVRETTHAGENGSGSLGSASVRVNGWKLREGNEAAFYLGRHDEQLELTDKEDGYKTGKHYFAGPAIFPPAPFFLGWSRELKEGQNATHPVEFDRLRSHTLLDELVISQSAPLGQAGFTVMRERWMEGRYYKKNDAVFTSVPFEARGSLRGIRWTAVLPSRTVRNGYLGRFEEPDPTLAGSRIRVRLQKRSENGEWENLTGWMDGAQGMDLSVRVNAPVRYQVRFEPTPGWSDAERLNQPVLETPFLDDVTISWIPGTGPEILSWSE